MIEISVCIATYNGADYIYEQIESILSQLPDNSEIIVSDDGSTDMTIEIVDSFKNPRIKILHSNKNNVIKNFENAINKAQGKYIFLADQDDIWCKNKVEICLQYLRSYDLVFSNLYFFQTDKGFDSGEVLYKNANKTGFLTNLIKNNCIGATMAFDRRILLYCMPFPEKIIMHDIWLLLMTEIKGKTYYIDEPLIYYRRHANTVTRTGEKSGNSYYMKMKMRYHLFLNILKRSFKNG